MTDSQQLRDDLMTQIWCSNPTDDWGNACVRSLRRDCDIRTGVSE